LDETTKATISTTTASTATTATCPAEKRVVFSTEPRQRGLSARVRESEYHAEADPQFLLLQPVPPAVEGC
jgi:hypothetical protein